MSEHMSGQSCAQTTRTDDFTTPSPQTWKTECNRGPEEASPYFFLAAPLAGVASGLAPLDLVPAPTPPSAEPVMPKRCSKRCTRPPRSTDWRTPAHAGGGLGLM